jgi:hypothetical protein
MAVEDRQLHAHFQPAARRIRNGTQLQQSHTLLPADETIPLKTIRRDLVHYRGFSTKRPVVVYMSLSHHVSGSTAASFAAFVACAVFVVYAQALYQRKQTRKADIYIGWARERSLRRMESHLNRIWKNQRVRSGEARHIWKELDDTAFRRKHLEVSFPSQALVKHIKGQRSNSSTLPALQFVRRLTDPKETSDSTSSGSPVTELSGESD